MSKQTYLTLNNGVKIPQFGIGVFLINGEDNTEKAVLEALKMGYRHIDTAHAYFNERGVGAAVKKSGIPRNEIFVTSKLWPTEYGEGITYPAVMKMLKRTGLDYLDMVLLHHPMKDYIGAWKDLEKLNKEGKVKAIGISNFDRDYKRLEELLKNANNNANIVNEGNANVDNMNIHPLESLKKDYNDITDIFVNYKILVNKLINDKDFFFGNILIDKNVGNLKKKYPEIFDLLSEKESLEECSKAFEKEK